MKKFLLKIYFDFDPRINIQFVAFRTGIVFGDSLENLNDFYRLKYADFAIIMIDLFSKCTNRSLLTITLLIQT
jgi:hypothetical protein